MEDFEKQGFSKMQPFKAAKVEDRMKRFAKEHGITLAGDEIYMTAHAIAHSLRDTKKAKGLAVSESDLVEFPANFSKMELYFDSYKSNFIYTDGNIKFIIEPNYEIKVLKNRFVNYITAQIVGSKTDFNKSIYIKIK